MKYYKINFSIGKDVGNIMPQANESLTILNNTHLEILNQSWLKKINDLDVVFPIMILRKKAKKTDLISVSYLGYSSRLLISNKLKYILEKYQNENIQFFKTSIVYKDVKDYDYWVVHPYKTENYLIDFEKSIITEGESLILNRKKLVINNYDDFIKIVQENNTGEVKHYIIDKVSILDGIKKDFFIINFVSGGIGYYVSAKLKQEIENAGCTGIAFELINQD